MEKADVKESWAFKSQEAQKATSLNLTKGTLNRLKSIGTKSETYDELINRLLDEKTKKEGVRA